MCMFNNVVHPDINCDAVRAVPAVQSKESEMVHVDQRGMACPQSMETDGDRWRSANGSACFSKPQSV